MNTHIRNGFFLAACYYGLLLLNFLRIISQDPVVQADVDSMIHTAYVGLIAIIIFLSFLVVLDVFIKAVQYMQDRNHARKFGENDDATK